MMADAKNLPEMKLDEPALQPPASFASLASRNAGKSSDRKSVV